MCDLRPAPRYVWRLAERSNGRPPRLYRERFYSYSEHEANEDSHVAKPSAWKRLLKRLEGVL